MFLKAIPLIFLLWGSTAWSICAALNNCTEDENRGTTSKKAYPTSSSRISMNPSEVPLQKGFGVELLEYKSSFDFSFVQGLGQVGAAISPSNSDNTFFGASAFELPENKAVRIRNADKYKASKYTFAVATNLFETHGSGWGKSHVNIGVLGRYNKLTQGTTGGGGISGAIGSITFDYSLYQDQTQLDYSIYGLNQKPVIGSTVESYSVGIFLSSFAFDYSVMKTLTDDIMTVSVLTGSMFLKRGIITISARDENSDQAAYDFSSQNFKTNKDKIEYFAGGQWTATSKVMLGVFYNYYLLHELSFGVTVFL